MIHGLMLVKKEWYYFRFSCLIFHMAARVCCLCRAAVAPNRSIYIFSASAVKNKWASRIGQLLETPLDKEITPYMCEMCKGRLINLEKAVADLAAFKDFSQTFWRGTGKGKRSVEMNTGH